MLYKDVRVGELEGSTYDGKAEGKSALCETFINIYHWHVSEQ